MKATYNELKYFLQACISINIYSYLLFYIKTFYRKVFKYDNKQEINRSLAVHMKNIDTLENIDNITISSAINIDVLLATKTINLNKDYDWILKSDDNEDIESLHRFNWIKYFLSSKNITTQELALINYLIIDWFNKNSNNFNLTDLRYTPYTMSERLCNVLFFYIIINKEIPNNLKNHLHFTANKIVDNLEIYRYGNGNHLINNLKSLIIYSLYFNHENLLSQSLKYFIYLCNDFIFNGFTKDYSSSYQLLFVMWLNEILAVSEYKNKNHLFIDINLLKKELFDKSKLFFDPSTNYFSYFGDITPDYNSEFMKTIYNNNEFLDTMNLNRFYNLIKHVE